MKRWAVMICGLLLIPLCVSAQTAEPAPPDLVNLDHLRFLTEPLTIDGHDMAVVHIYSETPDYQWVDAAGEGLSAVDVLAMSAYEQARPNATTEGILTKLADGIAQYRLGDDSTYPWGMRPAQANAPGLYHTWGAHMTEALVKAGMAMKRQDWIDSATVPSQKDLYCWRQCPPKHVG